MTKSRGPFFGRLANAVRTRRSYLFGRRLQEWPGRKPYISFTFDDFPRSSFSVGGKILEKYSARGTFYTSLGLLGTSRPSGDLFTLEDLKAAIAGGHEIGCHTFDHLNAWRTRASLFEKSIGLNQETLRRHFPDYQMRTLSYPFCEPHPRIKRVAGRHYVCCRGGGQVFNHGQMDLNLVKSCFIDYRNRDDAASFRALIDENARLKGWLVLSAHDLGPSPSEHGCLPAVFEDIVKYAAESSAVILPVREVFDSLGTRGESSPR